MQQPDTKAKTNQLKVYYHMHLQNNIATTFEDNSQ